MAFCLPWTPYVLADTETPLRSGVGGALSYHDHSSSIGIGIDSEGDISGELRHVLVSDHLSALLGEMWLQEGGGGIKLAYNWIPGDEEGRPERSSWVRKGFLALDRQDTHGKISLGGGIESPQGMLAGYLSHGTSGAKSLGTSSNTSTSSAAGDDNGRPYLDVTTTLTSSERLARAFDWGIGLRAGRYLDASQLAINLGFDHEWGRGDAKQSTFSAEAEKFFGGSPWSVTLRGELISRDSTGNDDSDEGRAWVILRYAFGRPGRGLSTYPFAKAAAMSDAKSSKAMAGLGALPGAAGESAGPSFSGSMPSGSKAAQDGGKTGTATTSGAGTPTPTGATVRPGTADAGITTEKRLVKMTASISTDTYFKFDSAALTPKATAILNQLLQDMEAQGYADNIKLTGHTCDIGTKEYNKRLSMRRAGSVKSYFVEKGSISANRIEALGMGEAAPRYPNTRGERFKNRRVDIEYLSYVSKEELVQVPAPGTAPDKTISGEAGSTPVATVVGAGEGGSAPGTTGIAGQPGSANTAVSNPEASARQPEMPVVIEWSRQEVELEPAWIQRALFHSLPHKRTVDTYVQVRERTSTSTSRSYINRLPMAADDSYTMDGAGVTSFPVLLNDSDPDGNTLSIASVTSAQYGSVSISGTQLVYTPSVMITQAMDSFTYTVSDGNGGTATARVTVHVSVNGVPLARDDRFLVSGMVPSRLDVLSNDLDPDSDPLNIVGFSQPSAGQINLEGSLLVFNPYGIFTGDTFSYTISDGRGGEATASVILIDP